MPEHAQILPATLDLLILKAVSPGPALRLRHSAAHRTDFTRGASDRTGRALPRAVSTCAAGIVEGSLGHVGEQSTDQVLRADDRRAETFASGGGRLEPRRRRNCLGA